MESLIAKYFTQLEKLTQTELFNVLGHLDVYKRYGIGVYGDKIKHAYQQHIDSLFALMVKHNLYLEVNTSGIRHGIDEYYPSIEIINLARRAGAQVSTIGSDAHKLDQLALDFETAIQIVHELLPHDLE